MAIDLHTGDEASSNVDERSRGGSDCRTNGTKAVRGQPTASSPPEGLRNSLIQLNLIGSREDEEKRSDDQRRHSQISPSFFDHRTHVGLIAITLPVN